MEPRQPGRPGDAGPGGRASAGSTTSSSRSSACSRTPPGRRSRRTCSWSSGTRSGASPTTERSQDHAGRGAGPAGRRAQRLRAAGRERHQRRHDRPERGHGGATDLSSHDPPCRAWRRRSGSWSRSSASLGFREMTTDRLGGEGLDRGRRHPERPGLRRADVRDARRRGDQHRDDLHLRDPDHHDHCRGPCRRPCAPSTPPRARAPRERAGRAAAGAS